jgi:hypothetical protein
MVLACGACQPLLAQSLSVGLAAPTSNYSSVAGASQSFTFSLYDSAGIADMNSASLAAGIHRTAERVPARRRIKRR